MIEILKIKDWLKRKKMQRDYELNAYHSIDAAAELSKMLTENIEKEFIKELQETYNKMIDEENITYKKR